MISKSKKYVNGGRADSFSSSKVKKDQDISVCKVSQLQNVTDNVLKLKIQMTNLSENEAIEVCILDHCFLKISVTKT